MSDEIETLLSDCEARAGRLTPWETEFLESVTDQYGTNGGLSPAQVATLERIWDRVTGEGWT